MSLAPFVRIVARGKGRARPLTQDEAHDAMSTILSGDAAPEAVGALLMVLRLRGETGSEIAGFTSALRSCDVCLPKADLDWPCYAAGRTRGAPLFVLAAKLVGHAGYTVSMHGWNSHQSAIADPQSAMNRLGLVGEGLHYHPLETLSPRAFALLRLRDTFGLRSCINTVLRMWNPSGASASVQGVFHPSYRGLQSRAAQLLGDRDLTVIKGGGGEFEANPAKELKVFGLRGGAHLDETMSALLHTHRRLQDHEQTPDIAELWSGAARDPFAEATIVKTAALALWTLNAAPTLALAGKLAQALWQDRHAEKRKTA